MVRRGGSPAASSWHLNDYISDTYLDYGKLLTDGEGSALKGGVERPVHQDFDGGR